MTPDPVQLSHSLLEALGRYAGDMAALWPEILLALGVCLLLLADLRAKAEGSRELALLALLLTVGALGFALAGLGADPQFLFGEQAADPRRRGAFLYPNGLLVTDSFSSFFKAVILLATAVAILQAYLYRPFNGARMGEYYALLLAGSLGGCLMASANDLLIYVIGIELLSIPSYVLVAFLKKNRAGSEGALKYIIYGGASTGFMLYGVSLLYGMTGTTRVGPLVAHLKEVLGAGTGAHPLAFAAAAFFTLAGFGYKMAFVPMHFWCPDAYEGAPTPFTAYLSVASKAAGFAIFLRFINLFHPPLAAQEPGATAAATGAVAGRFLFLDFDGIAALLAALTMTLGNLAALWQRNVKRLLAYSSIAHAGYLLIGVAALAAPYHGGLHAVAFYFLVYLFMNLGAFLVVILVENETGSQEVEAFRGLGRRSPLLAGAMALCLFSLIGVPPTAGFVGKFQIFAAAFDGYAHFPGKPFLFWVLILAVINTAISVYYYARILKAMYLDDPEGAYEPFKVPFVTAALVAVLVFPVLYLGIFFGDIHELAAVTALAAR